MGSKFWYIALPPEAQGLVVTWQAGRFDLGSRQISEPAKSYVTGTITFVHHVRRRTTGNGGREFLGRIIYQALFPQCLLCRQVEF